MDCTSFGTLGAIHFSIFQIWAHNSVIWEVRNHQENPSAEPCRTRSPDPKFRTQSRQIQALQEMVWVEPGKGGGNRGVSRGEGPRRGTAAAGVQIRVNATTRSHSDSGRLSAISVRGRGWGALWGTGKKVTGMRQMRQMWSGKSPAYTLKLGSISFGAKKV